MCGIAGIYNHRGLDPDREIITRMSAALSHRGPDAEGFHVGPRAHLAARRLSIIDLQAGAQPVYTRDRSRCIVFNGEIYNYMSLREELAGQGYAFQTRTDTEVVLAAYCLWGEQCLERFRGMFAFAVWDGGRRELFLARDRFGIKPLYISQLVGGTFLFASEIKALLEHPDTPRRLYPSAIRNLLTYGFNTAPHTFFQNVKQVLPGHCVRAGDGGVSIRQYWDIDVEAPVLDEPPAELAARLRQELERSVRESLVADVPVAAYLSGGIDSSAVAGIYSRLSPHPVTTITITFDDAEYNEAAYSRQVSGFFGTENIEFRCGIAPEDISSLVYYLENPLVSLLNLPLYLLSQKTRELGIKVVLTGDGADEVLGGYDYFRILKAMAFIERTGTTFRKNILRKIYPQLSTPHEAEAQFVHLHNVQARYPAAHPALPYQFQEFQFKQQLYAPEFARCLQQQPMESPFFFSPDKIAHRPLIDQALYIETKMRLLNLTLPLSDKMSMANSVEVRPLFLDHDLVNFLFRVPHHCKIRGLSEKQVLKQSMAGLLPGEICGRKKQPLQPPGKWFVEAAGDMLRDHLAPARIRDAGYFNPAFVDFVLSEYDGNSRVDYSGVIVVLFFIQLWHDIFLR